MALSLSGFITRFKRFILDSLERGRAPVTIASHSLTHMSYLIKTNPVADYPSIAVSLQNLLHLRWLDKGFVLRDEFPLSDVCHGPERIR